MPWIIQTIRRGPLLDPTPLTGQPDVRRAGSSRAEESDAEPRLINPRGFYALPAPLRYVGVPTIGEVYC
jgi:hypothetical protein